IVKNLCYLGKFSVSGGDPDCSPALKCAAEVLLTAPAYSAYVFLYLNFSRTSCSRDRSAKLPYHFKRGTVIVKLNTKPCQAKNAFPSTPGGRSQIGQSP